MDKSCEEMTEDAIKSELNRLNIKYYTKNNPINSDIDQALTLAPSKSGGGKNYPDIKLLLENGNRRFIPVMVEVKGSKGKLEKLDEDGGIIRITLWESDKVWETDKTNKQGEIIHRKGEIIHKKGDENYKFIQEYAVNGALHYGKAILNHSDDCNEVIVIGING